MNRDRKKKQKEPYNKATNNKGKNGTNNVRWKKGKFKGNGNGLSDTRGNRRNNTSYGFSNRNSSVKFRVTLDGSGDVSKGRGRNNNNNRNKRNNNRRRQRAPPVMKPQPRSEADLDADLESYRQKAPKKPVTADDLDADMDAYNSKRKQPKDDNAEGDDIAGDDEK